MPEDRQVNVSGEPQCVDDVLEAAAEEARGIAGRGFGETTSDDVREMIRPVNVTPEELLQEDEEHEEEEDENEDGNAEHQGRVDGLPMRDVKLIIELGGQLCHLLEQDSLPNLEERTSFLKQALAGYKERYHKHIKCPSAASDNCILPAATRPTTPRCRPTTSTFRSVSTSDFSPIP